MKMKHITALMLMGGMVLAAPAFAQNPNAVKVFVGYGDTTHTSPGFLPYPVPLPAGVVFIGTGNPVDAGVIMLQNPSANPLLVDMVTVDIGTSLGINPWSMATPFTIPGKGTAILTQTSMFNFDTSEGFGPQGTCAAPNKVQPVVHVTVGTNLNTKNFVDKTQVLNTGGKDTNACTGGNEGLPFVEIHP